jgi:hypothetical protein
MTKHILHVTVGDAYWQPSKKELKKLAKLFRKAKPDMDVVVTRTGVLAQVLEVPEYE